MNWRRQEKQTQPRGVFKFIDFGYQFQALVNGVNPGGGVANNKDFRNKSSRQVVELYFGTNTTTDRSYFKFNGVDMGIKVTALRNDFAGQYAYLGLFNVHKTELVINQPNGPVVSAPQKIAYQQGGSNSLAVTLQNFDQSSLSIYTFDKSGKKLPLSAGDYTISKAATGNLSIHTEFLDKLSYKFTYDFYITDKSGITTKFTADFGYDESEVEGVNRPAVKDGYLRILRYDLSNKQDLVYNLNIGNGEFVELFSDKEIGENYTFDAASGTLTIKKAFLDQYEKGTYPLLLHTTGGYLKMYFTVDDYNKGTYSVIDGNPEVGISDGTYTVSNKGTIELYNYANIQKGVQLDFSMLKTPGYYYAGNGTDTKFIYTFYDNASKTGFKIYVYPNYEESSKMPYKTYCVMEIITGGTLKMPEKIVATLSQGIKKEAIGVHSLIVRVVNGLITVTLDDTSIGTIPADTIDSSCYSGMSLYVQNDAPADDAAISCSLKLSDAPALPVEDTSSDNQHCRRRSYRCSCARNLSPRHPYYHRGL